MVLPTPKPTASANERGRLFAAEVNANDSPRTQINDLTKSSKVEDLKKSIARAIGQPESWEGMRVFYEGAELLDNDGKLSGLQIEDEDTFSFVRAPCLKNVFFRLVSGRTMVLQDVPVWMKVGQLKEKLGEEHHMKAEADSCRYIWSGKQLENDKPLMHYGLTNECTIHLVYSLNGGCEELPRQSK